MSLGSEDLKKIWPAESLAEELRRLNREYMRSTNNTVLKDRDNWPNQMPERFAEELAQAQRLGVIPVSPGDAGFTELIASAKRFNWAIDLGGMIWVTLSIVVSDEGPARISHAILVEHGGDVLAAGEGRPGDYLSNTTGHYKNETFVVGPVKKAFARIGILFKR